MSAPYYADADVTLWHGKSEHVLPALPDASVDAVVCDPPYELGFMGRAWDASGIAYNVDLWRDVLRVLKPGGHLLAFGGTRTVHRVTCAIEDAGFEIRDGIDWIYSSGFPKSLDVGKAIDRQRDDGEAIRRVTAFVADARRRAGVSHKTIDDAFGTVRMANHWMTQGRPACVPSVEQWQRLRELLGFGHEMDAEVRRLNGRKGTPGEAWSQRDVIGERTTGIGTGRGTVSYIADSENRNVTAPATDDARRWVGWGTALKPAREPIVVARKPLAGTVAANVLTYGTGALNIDACRIEGRERTDYGLTNATRSQGAVFGTPSTSADFDSSMGRWPSNVVLSHAVTSDGDDLCVRGCVPGCPVEQLGDNSRFFPAFRYEPKAPTSERPNVDGIAHNTVKPLDLMRWLVRLVTPTGGLVLDPFAGSGTTAEACVIEGFRCIAIEQDAKYLPLITSRLTKPLQTALFAA